MGHVLSFLIFALPLGLAYLARRLWASHPPLPGLALGLAAAAGAVGGVLAALIEPVILDWTELSFSAEESGRGALAATLLLAAPLEEALKAAAIWPWYIRHRIATGRFGAMLALCAGAGFAAGEGLVLSVATDPSVTFVLRLLVAVPAHLLFAAVWGYSLKSGQGGTGRWFSLTWTVTMAIHGLYDYLCFSRGPGMLLLNLPLLLLLIGTVWLVLRVPEPQIEIDDAPPSSHGSPQSIGDVGRLMQKPDRPLIFRLVLLGALVTLGTMLSALALAVYLGHRMGIDFSLADEADFRSSAPFVFLGTALLVAFPVSGYLVARAGSADSVLEPALGAGLAITGVLVLLGVAEPMALVAAVLFAPVAFALACCGAWFALERT